MLIKPKKQIRFFGLVRESYIQPDHSLVAIIRNKERYSVLLRAAALRNLVATSPVEVTKGRCYADRRRLVRAHYGI